MRILKHRTERLEDEPCGGTGRCGVPTSSRVKKHDAGGTLQGEYASIRISVRSGSPFHIWPASESSSAQQTDPCQAHLGTCRAVGRLCGERDTFGSPEKSLLRASPGRRWCIPRKPLRHKIYSFVWLTKVAQNKTFLNFCGAGRAARPDSAAILKFRGRRK